MPFCTQPNGARGCFHRTQAEAIRCVKYSSSRFSRYSTESRANKRIEANALALARRAPSSLPSIQEEGVESVAGIKHSLPAIEEASEPVTESPVSASTVLRTPRLQEWLQATETPHIEHDDATMGSGGADTSFPRQNGIQAALSPNDPPRKATRRSIPKTNDSRKERKARSEAKLNVIRVVALLIIAALLVLRWAYQPERTKTRELREQRNDFRPSWWDFVEGDGFDILLGIAFVSTVGHWIWES